MKLFESKHLIALMGVLALVVSGCASGGGKPTAQQFKAPETVEAKTDKTLFSKALEAQNKGQFESAAKLWQSFLSKYPDSFEGHNNLGLVYYTQDMLSQALSEFETAYRLNPDDGKIRKNLARALRFKASMLHENREYFPTLEILARLELIVEPEERQEIMFKQEQVEDQIFLQVIKADNSEAYQDFVNRFPDGLNAVRAREYLEKNPHANKKASKPKRKKITSNVKSWISSGQPEDSWASAEQPPDYSSSRPAAVYTPPASGGSKKTGDFFGSDSAAVEKTAEDSLDAPQSVDPVAAIPFEEFEKPERADSAEAMSPPESKESSRVASESDPMHEDAGEATASLDTLPDLTPIPASELPAEVETPPAEEEVAAGEIEMQPEAQEADTEAQETDTVETASTEETVEQAESVELPQEEPQVEEVVEQASEESLQEAAQPEMAQTETAAPETVESESERIARIVAEEIAKAEESAPSEQTQTEAPPEEPQVEEAVEQASEESSQEESMEVASIAPETEEPVAQEDAAPVESTAVEEPTSEEPTSDAEEKETVDQETVSETVAALMPTPPQPEAMEAAEEPEKSTDSMVVVQIRAGSTLNVRAEPSTQGKILGYLENGDMMPFRSESGDWYQIEIEEGLSGWISKKFSTVQEQPQVASVPEPSEPVAEEGTSSELTPVGAEPQQPQPKDAMVIVTVSEDATLNVRSLPSSSGAIVDMLFQGDKLPLIKEENGWYQVQFEDETTGWISKQFSVIEGSVAKTSLPPAPQEPKKDSPEQSQRSNDMVTTVVVIKVPEGSTLNVRSSPSSESKILGILKRGEMRPLLEEESEWYQVELQDGQSGWISKQFSGKMDVDSSFVQSP